MSAAPLLTILKDGETIKSQSLDGEMVLGRGEDCVIRLEDRAISRQHAVFRPIAGGVQVEKRSEFAPLSVNGLDCTKALVKEGDVIAIGPYLVKLSMNGAAQAQAPAPAAPVVANVVAEAAAPVAQVDNADDLQSLVPEESGDPAQAVEGSPDLINPTGSASLELAPFEDAREQSNQAASGDHGDGGVDENAKTKVLSTAKVSAKIVLPDGAANVTELEIDKDEVSIGRGKDCDIVLDDKKASRKHAIIRREGVSFSIKDLDSANGVFVNGAKVLEQQLSGDDILKIGNIEFRFLVLSTDYVKNQDKFIPVQHEIPEISQAVEVPSDQQVADFAQSEQQAQDAIMPPPSSDTNGLGNIAGISGMGSSKKTSLLEKFKAQPKQRQILIGIVILVFIWWFMDDSDDAKAPPPPKKGAAITAKGPATFESLTPQQKAFVEAQHSLAFDDYKAKEYDKAIFEIQKIFTLIPDYKDSREIERYAKDGKQRTEALEEEKRKKEEDARLKLRIAELVDQAKDLMAKKKYDTVRELFSQIFALDPDNQQATAWRKEVDQYEEQKRIKEQEENVQREINIQAWDIYKEGMKLKQQKQFREAIATLKKVMEIGATDKKVAVAAKDGIRDTQQEIINLRDPVLAEAKQAEDALDLPKAFALYKKATEIDPPYPDGYAGMERIRGILHDRAKVLYIDGVLAESYSDFSVAKKKFQECKDVAPKDDIYHDRAERKLASFFKTADEAPPQ
jgi:pSer/pThr/pTyr-binding forkhead associated (FHA) protein/tetratricopeptide (TPR) repeat protein